MNDGAKVGRLMIERSKDGYCRDVDAFTAKIADVVKEVLLL